MSLMGSIVILKNSTIMKKTTYLFWAILVCSTSNLFAQKMHFCNAFIKLVEQCDDFSVWKDSAISGEFGRFISKLEVEEADKSYMLKPMSDLSFVADFGTFDNKDLAIAKFEAMKSMLTTCFSALKFADTEGIFSERIAYVINTADKGFRFYKACLKVTKLGQQWTVSFEFPQNIKDTFTHKGSKSYADYYKITETADQSDFSNDVRKLLKEAKTGFSAIKGEKLVNDALFDQYVPTLQPSGKNACYIEDRGFGVIFYELPLLQNVSLKELQDTARSVVKSVQQILGPDFAYSQSENGLSISFVPIDRPYQEAAVLYVSEKGGSYNMTLSIKADKKQIN